MRLGRFLMFVGAVVSAQACGTEQDISIDDMEYTGATTSALFASPIDKGAATWGAIKAGQLVNTSTFEYVPRYRYTASAGQTVTFVAEVSGPQGTTGGAWLVLSRSSVVPAPSTSIVAQQKLVTSNRVHFDYTFAAAGTYYLSLRQALPVVGTFNYRLGAEPTLCVSLWESFQWQAPYPEVVSHWFGAKEFAPGEPGDPWAFQCQDPQCIFLRREVTMGTCLSQANPSCGAAGPTVFYTEMPSGTGESLANECEIRNHVYRVVSCHPEYCTTEWSVWWDHCAEYPEYC